MVSPIAKQASQMKHKDPALRNQRDQCGGGGVGRSINFDPGPVP